MLLGIAEMMRNLTLVCKYFSAKLTAKKYEYIKKGLLAAFPRSSFFYTSLYCCCFCCLVGDSSISQELVLQNGFQVSICIMQSFSQHCTQSHIMSIKLYLKESNCNYKNFRVKIICVCVICFSFILQRVYTFVYLFFMMRENLFSNACLLSYDLA